MDDFMRFIKRKNIRLLHSFRRFVKITISETLDLDIAAVSTITESDNNKIAEQ
jgi:hypothetical protein